MQNTIILIDGTFFREFFFVYQRGAFILVDLFVFIA